MKNREYEDELKKLRIKRRHELLKVKPDIEESDPSKVGDDSHWEGWLDFDIGIYTRNINMVSIKVSGPQDTIADAVKVINKKLVGDKLTRKKLEHVKRYLAKRGIEVLDEEWSRKTSEETGIK